MPWLILPLRVWHLLDRHWLSCRDHRTFKRLGNSRIWFILQGQHRVIVNEFNSCGCLPAFPLCRTQFPSSSLAASWTCLLQETTNKEKMVRRKGTPRKYISPFLPPLPPREPDTEAGSSSASRSTESDSSMPPGMLRATPTKNEFSSTDSEGDRSGASKSCGKQGVEGKSRKS